MSDIKLDNSIFEEELGYSLEEVVELFKSFKDSPIRKRYENICKVLEYCDRGLFWDKVANKALPGWSVKPDTNYINYIKTNLVNSIYTGSYRANVFPRRRVDMATANSINEFLDYTFDKLRIPYLQTTIGARAALLNLGAIELGWNNDVVDLANDKNLSYNDIEIRELDNLSLYLDPTVNNFVKGKAVYIQEEVPIIELQDEDIFRDRVNEYLEAKKTLPDLSSEVASTKDKDSSFNKRTVVLNTCYHKYFAPNSNGYRIDKIWFINNEFILAIQKDIKPRIFPIRVLYCSPPVNDPYGVPLTKLVLNNVITANLMDAVESTTLTASLERSVLVSRSAGLPEALFSANHSVPGKVWFVNNNVENIMKPIELPELPRERHLLRNRLEDSISRISGIDDRYTGRDTGSTQTTGGMDILMQRLTMSDNERIVELSKWIVSIAELIMMFYMEHAEGSRSYPKKNPDLSVEDIIDIDFEELRKEQLSFDFTCDATPNLPKNVARLADTASQLMEMQMQYQSDPPLITQEEWLSYQDIPQKHMILRRIQDDRRRNDVEDIQSMLVNYAGMVNQGVRPEKAVDQLAQESALKRRQPSLGNTGGGTIQAHQKGL